MGDHMSSLRGVFLKLMIGDEKLNCHTITKKYMKYKGLELNDPSSYYMHFYQFKSMIKEHGKEFIDFLLEDTIMWATETNYNIYSPKFLLCRVDEVKQKFNSRSNNEEESFVDVESTIAKVKIDEIIAEPTTEDPPDLGDEEKSTTIPVPESQPQPVFESRFRLSNNNRNFMRDDMSIFM